MSNRVRSVGKRTIPRPASNGALPPPFFVRKFVWHCNAAGDADGLCIEVRSNLSLRERDDFVDADDAITAYSKEWTDTPDEDRDHVDTPRKRQIDLILPFIRNWNVWGHNVATGEDEPLPPPGEIGPEAFQLISLGAGNWILSEITMAYRWGKGLSSTSFDPPSEPTAETSAAGTSDDPSSPTNPSPTAPPS